jgi:hypothetical protein
VNLDSINNLHEGVVTLSPSENGGAFTNDGGAITDPARLLHFNGHVMFGNIDTIVTNVANTPAPGTIVASSYLQSQLQFAAADRGLQTAGREHELPESLRQHHAGVADAGTCALGCHLDLHRLQPIQGDGDDLR